MMSAPLSLRAPLILASNSPRRKALLSDIGLTFEVLVRPTEERIKPGLKAEEVAMDIAEIKAKEFLDLSTDHIILAADTIVVNGDNILGKPQDRQAAIDMLTSMSGKGHEVITGVAFMYKKHVTSFFEETTVRFADLSEAEIAYYVDQYHPFDKAGAYGIQEWIGKMGIEGIEGDFYNVVGLPVARVYAMLKQEFSV